MSTDSATRKQSQILNVPNILSMIRLFMAFIVVGVIPFSAYQLALVLFVVAASTDWIDGWWARKFDQVTQLGRILDPFCDKMIICGTYIVLAVEMRDYPWYIAISGWMAVVVVGREMLVTALRSFIEQSGGDFSAKMAGKLKMVFQCIAVAASLVMLTYTDVSDSPMWVYYILLVSVWLALALTLYSGAEYVIAAAKFVKSAQRDDGVTQDENKASGEASEATQNER
ncbi:MAG: CDP-diacylglycerol--glycerol-3-phosphate 3-phosphatidyltransferase [Planctomycetota bacterium]|nr:CDP-diacylglycerol--glycerol-3-phosphate 3-phosphatidyltransferase [Planctomycetota bacterium]